MASRQAGSALSPEQKNRMIESFLKQCKDFDKDQRYMATSDLGVFLQQADFKLDTHRERDICEAILKQFDDSSIDVQSIAVRTVPLLVTKVQPQQVVEICSQLCEKMLTGEESVRNLYAIGLKTCVSNLPEIHAQPVLQRVVPKLVQFIERDTTSPSVQDALEVTNDILSRFGSQMEATHEIIIKAAIAQLSNPNNLVRKRAIGCLGAVSIGASDVLLNRMVETILGRIDSKSGSKESVGQETIFVQAIGAIGRASGNRLGQHVDRIVPLLFHHLKSSDDESMQTPQGDDHRENIFQGLESFVLRCPNEIQPHLEQVIAKTSEFLVYDPNFNYGDDDEDMDEGSEDDDDNYSNFEDEDDDTSWKVRRSAAKVLNSIIVSRPDALGAYYSKMQELLQRRFQERVESVRLDVLEAYKSLLDATAAGRDTLTSRKAVPGQTSALDLLIQDLNNVVKALSRLLKEKSKTAIKTKIMAFQVASRLISVVQGKLDDSQLGGLLLPAVPCLSDKNSTLRLEALLLVKTILLSVSRVPLDKCDQLKQPLVKCIQAEWFRIVSEALKCIGGLCHSVRPIEDGMQIEGGASDAELAQWATALTDAVTPRLKQHDIDQEIKNSAIEAIGIILSVFGDYVSPDRQKEALETLLERVKNESSRLSALRALEKCARSSTKLSQYPSVFQPIAEELAVLLRQQSREIRQHSLSTYYAMVDVAGFVPANDNLVKVANELGNLIADSKDSTLAHLALSVSSLFISKLGVEGKAAVRDHVAQSVFKMTCTSASLLTGQAYQSLLEFYRTMTSQGHDAGLGFDAIFPQLFPVENESFLEGLPKSALPIIAESCGVVTCATADADVRDRTLQTILSLAQDASRKEKAFVNRRLIALTMLGEIGRRASLGAFKSPVSPDVVVQRAFKDEDESIKVAAASSLGKLVVGDPQAFLPVVMSALEQRKDGTNHYLVLVSLREVLSSENATSHVSAHLNTVVTALKTHCSDPNEEVRNMVAECFGKLCILFPSTVVPELVSQATDMPEVRWTKVTAMRYAIVALVSTSSKTADEARAQILKVFNDSVYPHLADKENVEVNKAALMAVHSLVHHVPDMAGAIFPQGQDLADIVYASTEVREELQKKVDFGPFKVVVDDGLPLRKSAFACLSAMLDNAPDLLGSISGQLVPAVARGLADSPEDAPDIPFVCHQILSQLCARFPLAILSQSSVLMKQFQKTLKLESKDKDKQERRISISKSAIRTLDQICALPGALEDRDVLETAVLVQKTPTLNHIAVEDGLKNILRVASDTPQ